MATGIQKFAAVYASLVFLVIFLLMVYTWNGNVVSKLGGVTVKKVNLHVPPSSTHMAPNGTGQPDLKLTKGHSLTLTIRMAALPVLTSRFYCIMLRSAALFWSPKLGSISLILDKESPADHEFAARLRKHEKSIGFKFDLIYEPLPPNAARLFKRYKSFGYNRQLWSFFFMDLYINASIIALTDTDGVFSAPVTTENIFNGDKLRVMGFDWRGGRSGNWDASARAAIGKPMISNFMTYFPSYIWRSTITNCRNYILKHTNVSTFEEAFRKMYPAHFSPSPINTVMSYAYYFEHDRYDWHLDVIDNVTSYNKRHQVAPGLELKQNDTSPYIHLTMHRFSFNQQEPNPMIQGYCQAQRHVKGAVPASCQKFQNATNFHLFEFRRADSHMETWCKGPARRKHCIQLIESHYANFVKYYEAGIYDLDLKRVHAVEIAAKEMNLTCPDLGLS